MNLKFIVAATAVIASVVIILCLQGSGLFNSNQNNDSSEIAVSSHISPVAIVTESEVSSDFISKSSSSEVSSHPVSSVPVSSLDVVSSSVSSKKIVVSKSSAVKVSPSSKYIAPAPSAPPSVPAALTEPEAKVVELVNSERLNAGLTPLRISSSSVYEGAKVRALEITSKFSHTRPDGRKPFTVLTDKGINYKAVGENLAYGQPSPEIVVSDWMKSKVHKANILDHDFEEIVVAQTQIGYTSYWVQIFIKF